MKTKVEFFDYKAKSEVWKYTPTTDEYSDEEKALQNVFTLLYETYTQGGDFSRLELFALLERANVSGGRLSKIKEKVNSITTPTAEDIAFIFTTIIGTEIYESAKAITDIDVFNASISRYLLNQIGNENKNKMTTFLNMYIRGCSAKSEKPSYEGWLQMSNKKN